MNKYLLLLVFLSLFSISLFAQDNPFVINDKLHYFPGMYYQDIRNILILTPVDETANSTVNAALKSIVNQEVTGVGYYAIPLLIGNEILKQEGFTGNSDLTRSEMQLLKEKYNIDALLLLHIYNFQYVQHILATDISISLDYQLISTATGETVWYHKAESLLHPGQAFGLKEKLNSQKEGLEVASRILAWGFESLPAGFYSPKYRKDQQQICYPLVKHESQYKEYNYQNQMMMHQRMNPPMHF
jgi:hypothetical protein